MSKLSSAEIEAICQQLKKMTNLRRLKPGDSFQVELDWEGKFIKFSLALSPVDIFQVSLDSSGKWIGEKKDVPVDKYWTQVSGEITSNLFSAMNDLQEEDQLVLDFADIFAAEIDFHSDPQPNDRFQIVVEKYYTGKTFVKYGRILYAAYQNRTRKVEAIYFPTPAGGGYYTPQGESLNKAFLKSPLKFTRISSTYTSRRRHPILGGIRPHYGVDYAAPLGAPVWAVAEGIVSFCGWNKGFGNQVIINHARGYKSMYGHLSRFAPGLRKGKKVRQKEVIGYVGSTGLATGPHLDFRLVKNDIFRNPLKEISPRAAPLPKKEIPSFKEFKNSLEQWIATGEKNRFITSFSSRERKIGDESSYPKS
ncbi:MAG: M23 family metallopeptidase [bacterium]